jgi:sulfur relay (sulfurtransferase) DsrC/TusE family protein
MNVENDELKEMLNELTPVLLPPVEYPPAVIVRDTPRDEILTRINKSAKLIELELSDEHYEVINFLFDFYTYCCESRGPGYTEQKTYWQYVDRPSVDDNHNEIDQADDAHCQYGQLSVKDATRGYRVFRILKKAFSGRGGSKYLYRLFPFGPLFTIHLLAQLPRLSDDIDIHYGTAF